MSQTMCEHAAPLEMWPRVEPPPSDRLPLSHPHAFLCDLRVDAAQLSSTIEHVSNVQYVRWLDRAAELHSDALGYTRKRMLDEGIMWFVARHEIDYLAEAWLGEKLIIATWVREIRRVKAWRDYLVVRERDGAPVCQASTLWVLVDLATRKPMRIPEAMIESFAPGPPALLNPSSSHACRADR